MIKRKEKERACVKPPSTHPAAAYYRPNRGVNVKRKGCSARRIGDPRGGTKAASSSRSRGGVGRRTSGARVKGVPEEMDNAWFGRRLNNGKVRARSGRRSSQARRGMGGGAEGNRGNLPKVKY